MKILGWSIFAFAALAGFLSGTNNVSIVSSALFALMGALITLLGLAEKISVAKADDRHLAGLESLDSQSRVQAIERWSDRHRELNTSLAKNLGTLLFAITAGFTVGLGAAAVIADASFSHVGEPWEAGDKPKNLDAGLGWMAIADKLQKAGYSQRQIRRVYDDLKGSGAEAEREASLRLIGRTWAGIAAPAGAASTPPPGAATENNPQTLGKKP